MLHRRKSYCLKKIFSATITLGKISLPSRYIKLFLGCKTNWEITFKLNYQESETKKKKKQDVFHIIKSLKDIKKKITKSCNR